MKSGCFRRERNFLIFDFHSHITWLPVISLTGRAFPKFFSFKKAFRLELYPRHDPDSEHFFLPGVYFAFAGDVVKIGLTDYPNRRIKALRSPDGLRVGVYAFLRSVNEAEGA